MKTSDPKVHELCDEIDYWKERAKVAEFNARHWKDEYLKHLKESRLLAEKDIANALMFALSVKNDKDGNLIIDKNVRKELAKRYRK